jgi:Enoyl-CoA hydratase/isomerase
VGNATGSLASGFVTCVGRAAVGSTDRRRCRWRHAVLRQSAVATRADGRGRPELRRFTQCPARLATRLGKVTGSAVSTSSSYKPASTAVSEVTVTVSGGVATVTISRPEARNAMTIAMLDGLLSALERLAVDDSVRGVVLTGAGSDFSVSADLSAMSAGAERDGTLGEGLNDQRIWDSYRLPISCMRCPRSQSRRSLQPALGLPCVR